MDMVEAIIIIIISQVMRTKVVVNLIVLREANGLEVTGTATVVAPTAVVLTAVAVLVTPTPFKLVSPSIAGQMGEVQVDLQGESLKSADCSKSDVLKRMVGKSNDTEIFIAGVKTVGLIDSGSQITSMSELSYQSLEPKPTLHNVKELGLSATSAGG